MPTKSVQRYFFEIAYDGTNYAGWQSQRNAIGIQTVVEDALSKILRTPITILGSGRTDAGVHCEQQFFHADLSPVNEEELLHKLNSFLPKDIAIRGIREVNPGAHARFDAIERSYQYRISLEKNPFTNNRMLYVFRKPDLKTMNAAAALLVGVHDFQCFSKVKTDVNNFRCEVRRALWTQKGDILLFDIAANRFLRGMVRAVVGTLLDVGTGKITLATFKQILSGRDRKLAGANVAPFGLYLTKVKYPSGIFIK